MPRFVRIPDPFCSGNIHCINIDHVVQVVVFDPPLTPTIVANIELLSHNDGERVWVHTDSRSVITQILGYDPLAKDGEPF